MSRFDVEVVRRHLPTASAHWAYAQLDAACDEIERLRKQGDIFVDEIERLREERFLADMKRAKSGL